VGETDSKPVDFAFPDLSEFGLTERETEAIGHLLRGRTSQESAELIGIKPSTVREYLRRAYRKIGVEGADQLRERYHLQLAVQGMSRGVEERGPDNSVGPVAEALLFATTLYLLLPVNAPHGVWGTGQDRLFALAAGMLASHTSVLCKRSDCRDQCDTRGISSTGFPRSRRLWGLSSLISFPIVPQ
jgi:DNA-binding CsgD family transcriptional regulator